MLAYMQFPTWLRAEIIPGLPFRWYGMMYLVAFAVSYLMFMVQVRQRKLDLDKDLILNFFFWAIIGMLIGARIFSTLPVAWIRSSRATRPPGKKCRAPHPWRSGADASTRPPGRHRATLLASHAAERCRSPVERA